MQMEVEACGISDLFLGLFSPKEDIPFPAFWLNTSTGRSATLPILSYFHKTGIFTPQHDQILVPQWLCLSLLQTMRKYCTPVLNTKTKIQAALVYHQYGFPQNMDSIKDHCDRHNIKIIEDCANLFEGYYKGQRLGTIGEAGIFSLSKVFPSVWGAGLATKNEELFNFASQEQIKTNIQILSFPLHAAKFLTERRRLKGKSGFPNLTSMTFANAERVQRMNPISHGIISHYIKKNVLAKRRRNYLQLRKEFSDTNFFEHLEIEGVFPYVAPLKAAPHQMEAIVKGLQKIGIISGVYNFDMNRNLFDSKFEPCAWIPVHQGLSEEDMQNISNSIKRALT